MQKWIWMTRNTPWPNKWMDMFSDSQLLLVFSTQFLVVTFPRTSKHVLLASSECPKISRASLIFKVNHVMNYWGRQPWPHNCQGFSLLCRLNLNHCLPNGEVYIEADFPGESFFFSPPPRGGKLRCEIGVVFRSEHLQWLKDFNEIFKWWCLLNLFFRWCLYFSGDNQLEPFIEDVFQEFENPKWMYWILTLQNQHHGLGSDSFDHSLAKEAGNVGCVWVSIGGKDLSKRWWFGGCFPFPSILVGIHSLTCSTVYYSW